jgi:hypothetical protein
MKTKCIHVVLYVMLHTYDSWVCIPFVYLVITVLNK